MRKDSPRLECYGTVDELNASIGLALSSAALDARMDELAAQLSRVQHELFNLGSILSTAPGKAHPRQARITDADIARLEADMDRMTETLAPLTSFVLPGGTRLNAELHLARTVCRRAERLLVAAARLEPIDAVNIRYLNRLSDALFVWSRWASARAGAAEVLWSPNQPSASGRS